MPVLTGADELAAFERPFPPRKLLAYVFLGGPLAGAWLLARNARRLGLAAQVRRPIVAGAVPAVLL